MPIKTVSLRVLGASRGTTLCSALTQALRFKVGAYRVSSYERRFYRSCRT